jgi:hypothetical protein
VRILFGSIFSAVALFLWGYVYWTVLPFPQQVIKPLPNEDAVVKALQAVESGTYRIPGPPADAKDAAALEEYAQEFGEGPLAMLFYRSEGDAFMSPRYFAYGFLQMWLAAFAAAIAVSASDIGVYPGRVMLVVWMGIFCAIWSALGDVAWLHFPLDYFWLKFGYTVSSALILGLVLALFVRPPRPPA